MKIVCTERIGNNTQEVILELPVDDIRALGVEGIYKIIENVFDIGPNQEVVIEEK